MKVNILGLKNKKYSPVEKQKISNTIRGEFDCVFMNMSKRLFDKKMSEDKIYEKENKENINKFYDYTSKNSIYSAKLNEYILYLPRSNNKNSREIDVDEDNICWISESVLGTIILTSFNLDKPIIFTEKEKQVIYNNKDKLTKKNIVLNLLKSRYNKNHNLYNKKYTRNIIQNISCKHKVAEKIKDEIRNYNSIYEYQNNYFVVIEKDYVSNLYRLLDEMKNCKCKYKII